MHTTAPQSFLEAVATSLNQSHPSRRRHPSLFPQHSPLFTDFQHPIIQRIWDLRGRDSRERSGLYYAEGLRFVYQAVEHHAGLEALVVCHKLLTSTSAQRLVRHQRRCGVPILDVSPRVLHELTLVEDPQGIGAVVRQRWESLEHITPGNELCWIALQTVRSAGNLGTILRTADAVGSAGLILLGNAVDPYAPAAVRATMGALHTQRMARTTVAALARWKQRHHCELIGTSPTAPTDYSRLAYQARTVLLMGDERRGLPPELVALCDHIVRIPMVGDSDSLNLGVATGVMLYELFNQRRSP
jgi:TrmH family RNA methyltransferase